MNRNTELHFGSVPKINVKRSTFDLSSSVKTTFDNGKLIPLKMWEVLPADTFNVDLSMLVRMATPIYPVMDNLYLDCYFFFCPARLLWSHWKNFWGENDSPWIPNTEYETPKIQAPSGGWTEGTIADYLGIPTKISGLKVQAMPFRMYVKTWNDFFRDENLKSCAHMYDDETTRTGSNSGDYVTNAELGALPLPVAKMADYFTTCLPSAQKGVPVSIPLGTIAPISGSPSGLTANTTLSGGSVTISGQGLKQLQTGSEYTPSTTANLSLHTNGTSNISNKPLALSRNGSNAATIKAMIDQTSIAAGEEAQIQGFRNLYANVNGLSASLTNPTAQTTVGGTLSGLTADLSQATAATINQLRMAFAIQKYYETAARYGTRYIEYLRGIFGVTSSDARLQRVEYLGGKRIPINMDQILQTGATDQTSPLGTTGGFSCTISKDHMFTKSFEEHGFLMAAVCVRTEHTYQQGLEPMWTRSKWTDYYNPIFSSLSEQPVYQRQIYAQGNDQDNTVFGYQEAWADYRYSNNMVTGYMRSNATGSLDVWHYADKYASAPRLSSEWIDEPVENVDRTLAVTSQLAHQFIGDFYFKVKATRPMPVYSIPKLVG